MEQNILLPISIEFSKWKSSLENKFTYMILLKVCRIHRHTKSVIFFFCLYVNVLSLSLWHKGSVTGKLRDKTTKKNSIFTLQIRNVDERVFWKTGSLNTVWSRCAKGSTHPNTRSPRWKKNSCFFQMIILFWRVFTYLQVSVLQCRD